METNHHTKKYIDFHINLMSHKGKINEKVILNIAKKINLDIEKQETLMCALEEFVWKMDCIRQK